MLAVERKPADIPELVKDLPREDWVEYQDLSFNRYGSFVVADEFASDGAAVMLPGKRGGWITQFRRYKLPKEGKWDVYMAVRADALEEKNKDDAVALRVGISPPMNNFTTRKAPALVGETYKWIKVPGSPMSYEFGDEHTLYLQPQNKATAAIYVDRLIAIRHR